MIKSDSFFPDYDSTWPMCIAGIPGGGCQRWTDTNWCEHIAADIKRGEDRLPDDQPGTEFLVPYLPLQGVYVAMVFGPEINPESLPGVRRLMIIKKLPLVPDAVHEYISLWSPGEGRASICLTVRDWVQGQTVRGHLECPCSVHGWKQNKLVLQMDASQLDINDICILTEGACWFCYHELKAASEDTFLDSTDANSPALQQLHQQTSR